MDFVYQYCSSKTTHPCETQPWLPPTFLCSLQNPTHPPTATPSRIPPVAPETRPRRRGTTLPHSSQPAFTIENRRSQLQLPSQTRAFTSAKPNQTALTPPHPPATREAATILKRSSASADALCCRCRCRCRRRSLHPLLLPPPPHSDLLNIYPLLLRDRRFTEFYTAVLLDKINGGDFYRKSEP